MITLRQRTTSDSSYAHTMRNIANILLILTLFVFKANSQEIKMIKEIAFGEGVVNAVSKRKANKKIKKLKSYPEHFNLYFNSKRTSEFDRKGKIISQTAYKESGEIERIAIYDYNDSDDILTESFTYPLRPESNTKVTYQYNANNDLVQIVDSSGNYIEQTIFSYPSEFKRETTLRINDKYIDKWVTQTDTSSNSELTTAYNNNDSVFTIIKRWYNTDKKLLKQINFDNNLKPTITRNFIYDSNGNKTYEKEDVHFNAGIVEKYWIADSINNTEDFKTFHDGKLVFFSRTFFDNNGNVTKTLYFDPENINQVISSSSSIYKYDKNNNWIEKKDFWDDKIHAITYRIIEYYE